MKKILFAITALFAVSRLLAQDTLSKPLPYIYLQSGIAVPMAAYSNVTSIYDPRDHATPGGAGSMGISVPYKNKFYFGAEAGFFYNGFNTKAVINTLQSPPNVPEPHVVASGYYGITGSGTVTYNFFRDSGRSMGVCFKAGYLSMGISSFQYHTYANSFDYKRERYIAGNIYASLCLTGCLYSWGSTKLIAEAAYIFSTVRTKNGKILLGYGHNAQEIAANNPTKMRNIMLMVGIAYNLKM